MIGSCWYDGVVDTWVMVRPQRVRGRKGGSGWLRGRAGGSDGASTAHARDADVVHVAASNERKHAVRVLRTEENAGVADHARKTSPHPCRKRRRPASSGPPASAGEPAGRTGELTGRVTAWDWAGCTLLSRTGPAPH